MAYLLNKSSSRNTRSLVTADFDFGFGPKRFGKIVVRLHAQPSLRGAAESFGKTNCHFWTDAGALIDQIVQRLPGNTQNFGARGDAQSERLKAFFANDAARDEADSSLACFYSFPNDNQLIQHHRRLHSQNEK